MQWTLTQNSDSILHQNTLFISIDENRIFNHFTKTTFPYLFLVGIFLHCSMAVIFRLTKISSIRYRQKGKNANPCQSLSKQKKTNERMNERESY